MLYARSAATGTCPGDTHLFCSCMLASWLFIVARHASDGSSNRPDCQRHMHPGKIPTFRYPQFVNSHLRTASRKACSDLRAGTTFSQIDYCVQPCMGCCCCCCPQRLVKSTIKACKYGRKLSSTCYWAIACEHFPFLSGTPRRPAGQCYYLSREINYPYLDATTNLGPTQM
jgi:hypothetical protein